MRALRRAGVFASFGNQVALQPGCRSAEPQGGDELACELFVAQAYSRASATRLLCNLVADLRSRRAEMSLHASSSLRGRIRELRQPGCSATWLQICGAAGRR